MYKNWEARVSDLERIKSSLISSFLLCESHPPSLSVPGLQKSPTAETARQEQSQDSEIRVVQTESKSWGR